MDTGCVDGGSTGAGLATYIPSVFSPRAPVFVSCPLPGMHTCGLRGCDLGVEASRLQCNYRTCLGFRPSLWSTPDVPLDVYSCCPGTRRVLRYSFCAARRSASRTTVHVSMETAGLPLLLRLRSACETVARCMWATDKSRLCGHRTLVVYGRIYV